MRDTGHHVLYTPVVVFCEIEVSTTETTITVNLELSETGTAWCQASAVGNLYIQASFNSDFALRRVARGFRFSDS